MEQNGDGTRRDKNSLIYRLFQLSDHFSEALFGMFCTSKLVEKAYIGSSPYIQLYPAVVQG